MGILDLFKRSASADEALQAVARHHGWPAVAVTGLSMLPPSHAAAGMHGLGDRQPPACGGRAFAVPVGGARCVATLSHLEIYQSDEEENVYDMVTWQRPPGSLPRFEAELGASAWQHHRLGDRFHPAGADTHRLQNGVVLRLSRDTAAPRAAAWRAAPGWTALMALAQRPQGLGGCVVEGQGDRVAVFTWTRMARKGQQRWHDLVDIAGAVDALITAAG